MRPQQRYHVHKRRQNKVILFRNPRTASRIGVADGEMEKGFAHLRALRNSTAREELPEKLKAHVTKLRRRG